MQKLPTASCFLRWNGVQQLRLTSILCVNRTSHHFRPKWFVEVLIIKHVSCHLHDDTIHMLHHSILLRPLRGGRLLLNVIGLQRSFKCLGNELPAVVWSKRLDFVLWLLIYKHLKFLEPLKALSFGLQHIQLCISWDIVNEIGYATLISYAWDIGIKLA